MDALTFEDANLPYVIAFYNLIVRVILNFPVSLSVFLDFEARFPTLSILEHGTAVVSRRTSCVRVRRKVGTY